MSEFAKLHSIADRYRAAYVAHDPAAAPISPRIRFSENNVALPFPDGSWDTVAEEVGPALTLVDVTGGTIGIFTAIRTLDVPGFLAVRLRVEDGLITEAEHILSTRRNLSGPPTPIGAVEDFAHDPDLVELVEVDQRMTRADLVSIANGYWSTLENNTGEIRDTAFSPDCTRFENGMAFPDVEHLFRLGRYRFNERVRDRDFMVVDEERGLVMSRAFIDHKGVLDSYTLTDGAEMKSIFREPHSWSVLELFKIKAGRITAIEATFIAIPYYMPSPWTPSTRWPA
ncbi:hypothetical protein [Sphingobium sp.]|uniref:hypothetical protein n=1 Tax=Sphingobium sp. TaxID=1912891 RepID=UPI0028BF1053|nr:hypothetical protein [Sphingobium sp.]